MLSSDDDISLSAVLVFLVLIVLLIIMFIRVRRHQSAVPLVIRSKAESLYSGVASLGNRFSRYTPARPNDYYDSAAVEFSAKGGASSSSAGDTRPKSVIG